MKIEDIRSIGGVLQYIHMHTELLGFPPTAVSIPWEGFIQICSDIEFPFILHKKITLHGIAVITP